MRMDENITQQIVEFVQRARITEPELYESARKLIADHIAASYAGYQYNVQFNKAVESVYLNLQGDMQADFFSGVKKLPVCTAAFMNAVYAHGADMDDGHRKAMGHIGASVISAVFALADCIGAAENEVLEAVIIGYQVCVRIAAAAQPGIIYRGFHATGVAGTVACAAACAKLLKLDYKKMYSALAIAVTQSSGLLIVGESGQLIKPLSPARAAEQGVFSALIAKRGVIGPMHPLESRKGWFHAMTKQYDKDVLLCGFDDFEAVKECYVKPYPSCRHTHCGIEAAIRIHGRIRKEIRQVVIYIYKNAIDLAGEIIFPKNSAEAKFSISYTLACALHYGAFGFEQLQIQNTADAVKSLIPKISIVCDPTMESKEKGVRGARVRVVDTDDSSYEETVLFPKGEPENAFDWNDITLKLRQCAKPLLHADDQQELVEWIRRFGANEVFKYKRMCLKASKINE